MEILILAIWIIVLLILHTLLVRFLEMRDITNQIIQLYSKNTRVPSQDAQYAAQVLPEPVEINQKLPEKMCETPSELTMEEELMNYVYNYQDPVLDESDKKITVDQVSTINSRLTPADASNVISEYASDECSGYESYNNYHDKFSL
jgi:hypothetical protein